ncbi:hypothetical protein FOA52_005698 [Chlamydomonas sp. UWO 241]|nr:hypothetical protein FOA52_005698 [Chlamydomonas sp. UWO 241]
MEDMATSKGYAIERHEVITQDGYKLATFRIPANGRGGNSGNEVGKPVLLTHGISLSSTCWVMALIDLLTTPGLCGASPDSAVENTGSQTLLS